MTQSNDNLNATLPGEGDVLAGRYELTRLIGTGGMGLIMGARQLSMDREVAIKLMRPEALVNETARMRFEREVHLAKEISHPNVVQMFDYGYDNNVAWVAMELLEGETLHDLIQRDAPLELGRAFDILEQILDGLTAAHRRSIVHRDLKPPNIFVTPSARQRDFIKVLDFGIARPLTESKHYVTTTGYVSGTLPYMAPEVLTNNEISPAADVYAAALVFLEMVYGRRIFDAVNPTQMALQHMRKDIPIPEALRHTELGLVLLRATAKRPENRYADADEFLAAVVGARAGLRLEDKLDSMSIKAAFDEVDRDVVDDLLPPSQPSAAGQESPATVASSSEPAPSVVRAATADAAEAEEQGVPKLALILLALVLVAIGIVGLQRFTAEAPAPVAEPPDAAPLALDVTVRSEPTGAQVWVDGEHRFDTPVSVAISERAEWELRKDGYLSKRVVVDLDTPRLTVHLEAVPAESPDVGMPDAKNAQSDEREAEQPLTAPSVGAKKVEKTAPTERKRVPSEEKKRTPLVVD